MLWASRRMTARFCGALSLRVRASSSWKTTSRVQWSWFSMLQWARTISASRLGETTRDRATYRTEAARRPSGPMRSASMRPSALRPGKSGRAGSRATGRIVARRRSARPRLRSLVSKEASSPARAKPASAAAKSGPWLLLRPSAYWALAASTASAMAGWQWSASAVTVQPLRLRPFRSASVAFTSEPPGARAAAMASRVSASQTLTIRGGRWARPLSYPRRSAFASTATTPCGGGSPSPCRSAVMKAAKARASSSGSRRRSMSEKVSCEGGPCRSRTISRRSSSRPSAKSAISTQLFAPHKVAASAMNKTSARSCRAFASRGSRTSRKIARSAHIGLPPHRESPLRIHPPPRRKHQNTQMRFPCPSRGGRSRLMSFRRLRQRGCGWAGELEELALLQGLLLEEAAGGALEHVAAFLEEAERALEGALDDALDLLVDGVAGLLAEVALARRRGQVRALQER